MLAALALSIASHLAPLPALGDHAPNHVAAQDEQLPGSRTPVPTEETRKQKRAELEKRLKVPARGAWTKAKATPLVRQALEVARASLPSSDGGYAALELTRDLAEVAADVDAGFEAIEGLENQWELDGRPMRRALVLATALTAEGDQRKAVGARSLDLAGEYIDLQEYELATELIDHPELKKIAYQNLDLQPRREKLEVREIEEFRLVRQHFEALKLPSPKPIDQHTAGYYLCFKRGDFERGLPLLAKGDFAAFAELAARDLKDPADPLQQLELAQAWLKLARSEIRKAAEQDLALQRAQHWLSAAQRGSGMTTAERERVAKLEAELGAALASVTAATVRAKQPKDDEPIALIPRKKGGRLDARFAGRNMKARGGRGVEQALKDGFEWLKWHQSADGSWQAKDYPENCGKIAEGARCEGLGDAATSVSATGLALLVFLGDGNTTLEGPYRDQVARGIGWLVDQQDPRTGLIGARSSAAFMYDHAIATQALCEAYYFSESPGLMLAAQAAVYFILRARNPYGAWRYVEPPNGENDTSVTGWMVLALQAAKDAKLKLDHDAFTGALNWIHEVTEPSTGRVGYDAVGNRYRPVKRVNDQFSKTRGEAMTAVGLLCRIFLGQDPKQTPVMIAHADLIARKLPVWNDDPSQEAGPDFYYWYYGSHAMHQMGGDYWKTWSKALYSALVTSQCRDGDAKGSWNPQVDPWGFAGGRVYTTAMALLALESEFRFARVLKSR